MNKKVMAAAVAVAVSAPALVYAQASTVQMYGSIRGEWSVRDEGTGRAKHDQMVNPGSSYIGFKGEESLGGGMSAWFQCESTMDLSGVGTALCMRNTAVGLKGNWGNFFVGNWDTPYKLSRVRPTVLSIRRVPQARPRSCTTRPPETRVTRARRSTVVRTASSNTTRRTGTALWRCSATRRRTSRRARL